MKKSLTVEELKAIRPRRGRRIINEKHERILNGEKVEQESFLNDVTVNDESMDDISRRPPTREEILAEIERNRAERRAEYASMGRTGRERLGELPPIGYKFPVRVDVSSESEGESDKENSHMDESMERVEQEKKPNERDEEMEKEADETTPVGQQRKTGLAGPSESSTTPANPPIPSTPPARPNSGFKKPNLPAGMRVPPRHSTPKANVRPRESFGTAFNNISIIANNSMHAPPSTANDSKTRTRKESTGSRGPPTLHVDSIEEEEVVDQPAEEVAPQNGTYDVEGRGGGGGEMGGEVMEGMDEEAEERQEDQSVRVHIEAVVMRRASSVAPRDMTIASVEGVEEDVVMRTMTRRESAVAPRDMTMASVDGGEEEEERVAVVGMAMRRETIVVRPPHPTSHEAMRIPVDGRRREERAEDSEEEVEDEEMASVYSTPARNPVMRPAKRPSLEHAIHNNSSPMAVAIARRSSGMRDAMVRPKVSMAPGRKISTGSVASTIPFEDLSRSNLSVNSSDGSYEEAKTPVRTPRVDRLLRQSMAARDQRQRVMPILEEGEAQGGEMDDEEEEEEDDDGMEVMRRDSAAATTPLNRQPRLSQRLQSSVDRLSQPRHRHDQNQPCARMISPARAAPVQRAGRLPQPPSPSPARRFHTTLNHTRVTMSGYTPNHRIDTTLMEDDGENRKSGLAPRIKRNPLRDVGRKARAAVLDVSVDLSDLEEVRRVKNPTVTGLAVAHGIPSKNTSVSGMSHATATPIVSPPRYRSPSVGGVSWDGSRWVGDGMDDEDEEEEEDNEREEDGEDDDGREESQEDAHQNENSMVSNASSDVFVRPFPPLPSTPKSAHGRRNAEAGAAVRRMQSDSDAPPDDMERLAKRASEISMESDDEDEEEEEEEEEESVVRRPFVAPQRGAAHVARVAAEINDVFNSPGRATPPRTPFRATIARNADLFSTDTPGIDRRPDMDTEEEEEWIANQDSRLWKGSQSTGEEENHADPTEDSQIDIVEDSDASARVLAPRKLIAPTGTPGVRRSTRTRMKPVRGWLGETAQYEVSPTTGNRRLVGVNEVTIRDKLFVQTGTADIQAAVLAKKKTAKQRGIANKKRKEQKEKEVEEFDEDNE